MFETTGRCFILHKHETDLQNAFPVNAIVRKELEELHYCSTVRSLRDETANTGRSDGTGVEYFVQVVLKIGPPR